MDFGNMDEAKKNNKERERIKKKEKKKNKEKSDLMKTKIYMYVPSRKNHANIIFKLHNTMQGARKLNISGCWK